MTLTDFEKLYEQLIAQKAKERASNWDELDEALKWARENGIVQGDSAGNMMPHKPITREEAILMMYRLSTK